MTGAWVVWAPGEGWGGCDRIFATEEDAQHYLADKRDGEYGAFYYDRQITFVPWGSCAD